MSGQALEQELPLSTTPSEAPGLLCPSQEGHSAHLFSPLASQDLELFPDKFGVVSR